MTRFTIQVFFFVLGLLSASSVFCDEQGIMRGMAEAHNKVRAGVGLPGLFWSDDLAVFAQEWADSLAREKACAMQHRPRPGKSEHGYGENLYWASAVRLSGGKREPQNVTPAKVVQSWVQEAADYTYATNSCRLGKPCGHYTQIVWQQTVKVGCGWAVCADKSQIWVCNYDPPGNVIGQKPY